MKNRTPPTYEIHELKVGYGFFLNYVYLIIDLETRLAAIIDPAWEWEKIKLWLATKQIRLKAVLLTHSHYDHVNLVEQVIKEFNSLVYISRVEKEYYQYECEGIILLDSMDSICLGCTRIDTFLTPGHTAGSVCFLLEQSLFTGDTLFIEGCGTCDTKGGNAEHMYESMQKLKQVVQPNVKIYPGHSFGEPPGHTFEFVMQHNIYLQFDKKEHFISFRMRENQTRLMDFK